MSITTKAGDSGLTSLFSGERVPKDDLRVDAYGTVDELDAHLADACHYIEDEQMRSILREIQTQLGHVMAVLASTDKPASNHIHEAEVTKLTELVHHYEALVPIKGLVVIGSIKASAKLDICRTIARRAERVIIRLNHKAPIDALVLQYINRLSDLLFIMARFLEQQAGSLRYK
ncbi:MAG TPA: cob(I)yrinic acid a,c-diamide adenosyltransferase [Candidatus Cloacimonadota bacterium]|nr:cob(I)yrinic acid a,c-diamide adenosyltransferase [Candidatus Cloacimonadota bacterium]